MLSFLSSRPLVYRIFLYRKRSANRRSSVAGRCMKSEWNVSDFNVVNQERLKGHFADNRRFKLPATTTAIVTQKLKARLEQRDILSFIRDFITAITMRTAELRIVIRIPQTTSINNVSRYQSLHLRSIAVDCT